MREPLEELAQTICNDTLVGLSSYIWNREYNLALAKRLKELNPNIIIVFGGPEMEILDIKPDIIEWGVGGSYLLLDKINTSDAFRFTSTI